MHHKTYIVPKYLAFYLKNKVSGNNLTELKSSLLVWFGLVWFGLSTGQIICKWLRNTIKQSFSISKTIRSVLISLLSSSVLYITLVWWKFGTRFFLLLSHISLFNCKIAIYREIEFILLCLSCSP